MVPEMHVAKTLVIYDFNDDELWAELGTRCRIRAEGNKFLLSPSFQQRILEDFLHHYCIVRLYSLITASLWDDNVSWTIAPECLEPAAPGIVGMERRRAGMLLALVQF